MDKKILGADEIYCDSCGAVVKKKAMMCPSCGVKRAIGGRSKTTALLLTFFLGAFGAQWFYLGKDGLGIFSILFCWIGIPWFVSAIYFWILLFTSEESFNNKYN